MIYKSLILPALMLTIMLVTTVSARLGYDPLYHRDYAERSGVHMVDQVISYQVQRVNLLERAGWISHVQAVRDRRRLEQENNQLHHYVLKHAGYMTASDKKRLHTVLEDNKTTKHNRM